MNLDMTCLEIVGMKSDLETVVQALHRLGCVQIDDLGDVPDVAARPLVADPDTVRKKEEIGILLAQIEGLLEALEIRPSSLESQPTGVELGVIQKSVKTLMAEVQSLTTRKDELEAEQASLPRYEATLRKLLPILPASAHQPGNTSVGVLVSRVHIDVLDQLGKNVLFLTEGRADVVASDVDASTRAMLIVIPREFADAVEDMLGQKDVSRLRLPANLSERSPDAALSNLNRRLIAIPQEFKEIDRRFAELRGEWSAKLVEWRAVLEDQQEAGDILSKFGETDMTFVLVGWVPTRDAEKVWRTLEQETGQAVAVRQLTLTDAARARTPIALVNPKVARPFEALVKLLALPQYGSIDPTRLMALFLPFLFGMMLGDMGYGFLLLVASLVLVRKIKTGLLHDFLIVLMMGSGWALVFGALFGEAFGTLGEHFGLHPLWFDRADQEYVSALLVMTLAVGGAHIILGLSLGVWQAFKEASRSHLLERAGMLLGLIALFLLVAVLLDFLPRALMTPAVAGLIIGIVLLGSSLGWLGILVGPIEFIGLIGNVLSYLRIAAIGLASVYLAKVANDMAGILGNLIVGLIVAVLIHALNIVLGAFSPTIHSLRLHYVEFFRKFYEGGGRPYQPFRSRFGGAG